MDRLQRHTIWLWFAVMLAVGIGVVWGVIVDRRLELIECHVGIPIEGVDCDA